MRRAILLLVIISTSVIMLTSCGSYIASQRREQFVRQNPKISERTREAILEGKIRRGMTKEEVIASWGKPYKVNRSVGSWGVREQWIYRRAVPVGIGTGYGRLVFTDAYYLYFRGNRLDSWQSR